MKMNSDPDHALAVLLQAQFNEEIDNKENLPLPVNKRLTEASLIDPEWEKIDPCPDIHELFVNFNNRFFWGRLFAVEVKWSNQMYSCAGDCVYEGRNGLCLVRLSAPLHKLRPRSDLVETLLHEMIHAYLFVTHNDRDRDGHGPEFHKHMKRINRVAGTNITVYHSFDAEVKSYQQYWWRCNGRCRYRPPFFGTIKRATDRAPSVRDRWWAKHQVTCGGHFVKVRDPEGYGKKKAMGSNGKKLKDRKDITNFFTKPANINGSIPVKNETKLKSSHGENSVNREVGFTDMSSVPGFSGVSIMVNREGGTLVVTGSQGRNEPKEQPQSSNSKLRINISSVEVFSESGFTVGSPSSSTIDRSCSHLLSIGQEPEIKKKEMDNNVSEKDSFKLSETDSTKKETDDEMCECFACNKNIPREEMDVHLETCPGLQNIFNNSSACTDLEDEKEVDAINKQHEVVACPVCSLQVQGDINTHIDECLNNSGIFNVSNDDIEISDSESPVTDQTIPKPKVENNSDVEIIEPEDRVIFEISDSESPVQDRTIPKPKIKNNSDVDIIEPEDRVPCPICGMRFGEPRINDHVNQCLDS